MQMERKARVAVVACFAPFLAINCAAPPDTSEGAPSLERSAEVLGEWELDLSDLGTDPIEIEIFAEDGLTYVAGSFQPDPTVLTEVDSLRFSTESPVDGHIEIEFLRDENGNIGECRFVVEKVGLVASGKRVGRS